LGDKEPPHRYSKLWSLTEDRIAHYITSSSNPGSIDLASPAYNDKRAALVQAIEAVLIRLLATHPSVTLSSLMTERVYPPIELKHKPLNRATAIETGGNPFTSLTGAAASAKSVASMAARIGRPGERVSISEYLRAMRGPSWQEVSQHRA
jgi:hypothetical protein